jgi:O-antigen ligase
MEILLIGLFLLFPLQHVLVLGGFEIIRGIVVCLGLAWVAGYLTRERNRQRIGSLAPWLLVGLLAITAVGVPFAVDVPSAGVRWFRFLTLCITFAVATPSILASVPSWRRAALAYLAGGTLFGVLNYHTPLFSPVALFQEIAANPTRFAFQNAFAYGGGVEGHGHEVGHYTSFAILLGLGLLLSAPRGRVRWLLIVLLAIATGALLISFTKSAWAGLALGFLVLYRRALRGTSLGNQLVAWSWVPAIMLLLIAAGFWFGLPETTRGWLVQNLLFRDVSGQDRLVFWSHALVLAGQNPLLGVGLSSLGQLSGDPHNWWIEMLAEGGVLAFGFALLFFWRVWRDLTAAIASSTRDVLVLRAAAAGIVASIAFQGCLEASFLWDFPTWAAIGLAIAPASWEVRGPAALDRSDPAAAGVGP